MGLYLLGLLVMAAMTAASERSSSDAFFPKYMSMAGNNIDIELLSTGIYQAMVTTVGGLIVGIIAFIFYNILVSQIDKVVNLLESKSIEFMDVLNEPAK